MPAAPSTRPTSQTDATMSREAIVVGAGPNGLVAALVLARAGWGVTVLEAASTPGGGTRTDQLTLPGVLHDVCSAIHPLAVGSPAFRELATGPRALADHGLEWIHPEVPLAHPLDGGRAAVLARDVGSTADGLGADGAAYRRLFGPLVDAGFDLTDGLLSPFAIPPRHPLTLARYGFTGIRGAQSVARRRFETDAARALFAGLSGHSILPLDKPVTAGYGLMLGVLGHLVGWPLARGGSQRIADALVGLLADVGGKVACDTTVTSLAELPVADAVLFDVTPRQLVSIAGNALPQRYKRSLTRFRYGPGVFKVDWALDGPIPWTNPQVSRAATVHVGGTLDEIVAAEAAPHARQHAERPFVLLAQPSLFDADRAPAGTHTAWAYTHGPQKGVDWVKDTPTVVERVEEQVERFAPGFRDRILARHVLSPAGLEGRNANLIGGDVGGGSYRLRQVVFRPVPKLSPYSTPLKGLYIGSAATFPGGAVHGVPGDAAAQAALK
jgi:phytoene dehydrogenase-like protein